MIRTTRHGFSLLLGLVGLVCFLLILNLLSDKIALVESNLAKGLEADAYFYSEAGDLNDFLDNENGRYSTKR